MYVLELNFFFEHNRLFREHNSCFNEHCFRPSVGRNVFLTSFSSFRRVMNCTSWASALQACAHAIARLSKERLACGFHVSRKIILLISLGGGGCIAC